MKHQEIIRELDLEEKCSLLSGGTQFGSRALPRKGIPSLTFSDGPHGLRRQAGEADHLGLGGSLPATCFPTAATVAASWDPALGETIGAALGGEAKAQGVNVLLGPGLNMKRNPLCGRNFEYFSEDPYLAGKLAAGYIRGIQSQGVSACPKHFAVNSQETRRLASDSVLDERTLREVYLTGFEIAVKEGKPQTIMTSYNRVNGTYANENEHLLQDILRKEWGYDGLVVTDWGGSNRHTAGVKAGSTVQMPAPGLWATRELLKSVKKGELTEKEIDARVEELLTLIDQTRIETPRDFDVDVHHALARKAAEGCIVLLKNNEGILPLKQGQKVAVIGDFARTPRFQGSGSSMVNATRVDSTLDCLKDSGVNVVGFAPGFLRHGGEDEAKKGEAVELAKKADVVLLYLGLDEIAESEGLDRPTMALGQNQIDVLNAVAAVNANVVVVFSGGSPVECPWIDNCKAFIHGCLGGQSGAAAMVDALTGKINPSGKLAETWPMRYADVPCGDKYPAHTLTSEYREGPYIGYRYYDTAGIPVRFPFGYGLSYTTFAYAGLAVTEKGATLTVTNTGKAAGTEVVELYIGKGDSAIYRPAKELKGFAKVALQPGESKQVTIPFDDKAFRYFNVKTNQWEVEGGTYQIYVGASIADIRLTGEIFVNGTNAPVPCEKGKLPSYYSGQVKNVSDAEFQTLLGRPIPSNKVPVDENITFGDLIHARSPIFWLVWLILRTLKNNSEKKGKPDLNLLWIWNMPLRALAEMMGGMVDKATVKALVREVQGWWLMGIPWCIICCLIPGLRWAKALGFLWCCLWAIVCIVKNLIQNALMDKRLK